MKAKFLALLESPHFHFTGLMLVALALALTGCASTKEEKAAATPTVSQVSPQEAMAMAITNCAASIKDVATAAGGDAASKVAAVGAIERLCGQGHNGLQFAAQQVQPQPQSVGGVFWNAAVQVSDLLLRAYGIKATRDVGITQSNNQAATSIASYQAFTNTAAAGFGSNAQIAGYIQAPAANVTTTLSGQGVIGSGTYTGPVTSTTTTNPAPKVCSISATGVMTCP